MDQQPTQASQAATQQATQPYDDPRRRGRNLSEMSDGEAADLLCVMHSNSAAAHNAIRATMLATPEHILQNDDLDGITEDDLQLYPSIEKRTREIALRMSSTVKYPRDGFRFGRNPQICDILLTTDPNDKLVSNAHFKIYINSHGSLMIQDTSTNGTIVDDHVLRSKDRTGQVMPQPATRALHNGSVISVLSGPQKREVKWLVRLPNRTGYEELYEEKLRKYLTIRGKKPMFTSIHESSFGNHWNGGVTYNFTGLLGKGAFAMVYRVQTKSEGTLYAAKEIDKKRFVKNGVLDIKFDNELKIMRSLKHPNIVDYVDCQIHDNWIYIIMEYLPYGELSKELDIKGSIPESDVQQITRQILRALDYLHRRKITHRDIKPDNILIASRDPLIVKLADFGLSKSVVDQETFLKTFCGTLLYCAPEVYPEYGAYTSGEKKRRRYGEPSSKTAPYDSSADMWSFGAVLFHLLCGKPPVKGKGDDRGAQMLNNIMTKEVDFEPLRQAGVSEIGIDFIGLMLNRTPAMRAKENECFQHPWLKDVPDLCTYENAEQEDASIQRNLEVLAEEDEDEYLMSDLNDLTQHQIPVASPSSPDRPVKKPKMGREDSGIPEELLYPNLPQASPSAASGKPGQNPKLFGEITPSLLKSSGVFGQNLPPGTENDLPQIQNQMEQVSMNDFGATPSAMESRVSADISGQPLQYPQALAAPMRYGGSAASLLGAEAQMGQMNVTSMASPGIDPSDAPTPETTNPVTPQTRELSPSNSVGKSTGGRSSSQHSQNDGQSRRINLDVLSDEKAFAETQKQRQAAREENARVKAETFHVTLERGLSTASLADTTNRITNGRTEHLSTRSEALPYYGHERRISLPNQVQAGMPVLERFGKLTPLEGSFSNEVISLTTRNTVWGRSPIANVRYADLKDVRVPKIGMKIIFYAPGIEMIEKDGEDWTQVPAIRTIIATSARKGIYINGVMLQEKSEDSSAALFGKIYSGDVITIIDDKETGAMLKYMVEIFFGDSAQPRPTKERPFEIRREYEHNATMKQRAV